jgi:hypothetical protein
MKDTPAHHQAVEHEIELAHLEHRELPLGYEDPHKAALEDNPEHAEKLTLAVILSAVFLGTSFTGPIIFGFILATPILVQRRCQGRNPFPISNNDMLSSQGNVLILSKHSISSNC